MAPEIIKGDQQTFALDWWSFGILIYEMIAGEAPFKGDSPRDILKSILSDKFSLSKKFSKQAKDIVWKLLNPDPESRLGSGIMGIDEIKNHKYFDGIDWEKVSSKKYIPPYIPQISSDSEVWNPEQVGQSGQSDDRHISQSKLHLSDANMSNFYFNAHDWDAL